MCVSCTLVLTRWSRELKRVFQMLAYLSVLFLCYPEGFFLEENVRKELKKKNKTKNNKPEQSTYCDDHTSILCVIKT